MNRLRHDDRLGKKVLALLEVPAWVGKPRTDLVERLEKNKKYDTPLENPFITHELYNFNEDKTINMFRYLGINNAKDENMSIIFIPSYLVGDDGIVNKPYYDVILGNDMCVYPSYYEPWGYTPLEAVAFKVPCITTDLAGFGLWANDEIGHWATLSDGVRVIHRDDTNYEEVSRDIADTVVEFSNYDAEQVKKTRENAGRLSKKALWSKFIKYYDRAYDMALKKASKRK